MTSRVGIVGCGRIGYAFMSWLESRNISTVGYDKDISVQERIATEFGTSSVASRIADLRDCISIHICVPTDPDEFGRANLVELLDCVDELAKMESSGCETRFISQRSTCPPGTADLLAERFREIDYGVHPSFVRKTSIAQDTSLPERIVAGGSQEFCQAIRGLYDSVEHGPFWGCSRTAAELLKYSENAIDSILIGFWNEILAYAEDLDLPSEEFVDLLNHMADRGKFASVSRVPGRAVGLWCLPKDLRALAMELADRELPDAIIRGALETNAVMEKLLGTGEHGSTVLYELVDGRVRVLPAGSDQVGTGMSSLRAPYMPSIE